MTQELTLRFLSALLCLVVSLSCWVKSESGSASAECDCSLHYIKFTVDGWVTSGQAISWSHRIAVNTAVS